MSRNRPGRRAGASTARDDILAAARELFAARGYDATSLRSIAESAGVDVALVAYYFGSKGDLFAASLEFPVRPGAVISEALGGDPATAGERLVSTFLSIWDDEPSGSAMRSVFRSGLSRSSGPNGLSEFIRSDVVATVAASITGPDAEARASVVAAQMFGLAVLRYVLGVEPLASLTSAKLAVTVGPVIQRLLTGD